MKTYTVQRGDTLSNIAQKHGVKSWMDIYNHPQNAVFRQKRPNPNKIEIGDVLFIPVMGGNVTTPTAAQPMINQPNINNGVFGPQPPAGLFPQAPPGFYDAKNHPDLEKNPIGEITTYKAAIHANEFSTNYLGKLKPGDILFTTEKHWLSDTIKAITDLPVSHVNLFTKPNHLIDSAGLVTERYIPPHFENNNFARAIAFQAQSLTHSQRETIIESARKFTNAQYDNMQLLAHGIATLSVKAHPVGFHPLVPDSAERALKRVFVRGGLITLDFIETFSPTETYSRTFGDRKKLMCSSLAVFSYMNAGYKFSLTNADLIGSDDLYHYCQKYFTKVFDVVFRENGIVTAS